MDNAKDYDAFFYGAPSGVASFCDDAFGYHSNLGMEFFCVDCLALNIDLKYALIESDIGFDGAAYDVSGETNIEIFTTGLGIKYYF